MQIKIRIAFGLVLVALATAALVSCGGGGSSSAVTTPALGPTVTTVVSDNTKTATVSIGGTSTQTTTVSVPASAVPPSTSIVMNFVPEASLPVSITSTRSRGFVTNAGNKYVSAYKIGFNPSTVTEFTVPISLLITDSNSTLPAGTTLNVAYLLNEGTSSAAWSDVMTITVASDGTYKTNLPSTSFPGIKKAGYYVIYQPAVGTSTAVANFGQAFTADNQGGAAMYNLYGADGKPLAVPVKSSFSLTTSADIDCLAMTADGSVGVIADGHNNLYFFKGANVGAPVLSSNILDCSAVGSDTDGVALTPDGDTAIVSTGDNTTSLLEVSGIVSGNPKTVGTITTPAARPGIALSPDGKTLLARGPIGLTVYSIAPRSTPVVGALGGTSNFSFTQVMDFTDLGSNRIEQSGRDGMAFSPTDSTKAVVINKTTGADITLITGLPGTPVVGTTLTLSGVTTASSIAVSQDGKYAVVGTDSGLILVGGVDTGTLTQISANFNPNYTYMAKGAPSAVSQPLGTISDVSITLDGKYVCVFTHYVSSGPVGSLMLFPILANGFGPAVSQVDNVPVPDTDLTVIH